MVPTGEQFEGFERLSRRISLGPAGPSLALGDDLSDAARRTRLAVKARWFLLACFGLYALYALASFRGSHHGLALAPWQVLTLLGTIAAVVGYNSVLHTCSRAARIPCLPQVQVLLDFGAATTLIYLSGGGASWFWPVYLVITIEAAFLLDRPRDVWILGMAGGSLFGLLLGAEHHGILPIVAMPFVDSRIHHDPLFLILISVWVALLNGATAVIATFLMSVIRNEARLVRESEERLLNFIENATDLIHCNRADGSFLYCNRAMRELMDLPLPDLLGTALADLVHPEDREHFLETFGRALTPGYRGTIEARLLPSEGATVYVEGSLTGGSHGLGTGVVWGIWRDVTERRQAQANLVRMAHHDSLTGLPNRILFADRLKQALALAHRSRKQAALLFLDLDRFKNINDTLGHPVGDQLLQGVAKRLTRTVREADPLSRFGGDEFTMVLPGLAHPEDAGRVAEKVLAELSRPFQVEGHELFLLASIGISVFPADGEDADTLVKKADVAMYHAKSRGGGCYSFYDPSLDEDAHQRLMLEQNLRKAVDKGELRLHYQPKVDLTSGDITALEALLRWQHPKFGLLAPDSFIPMAEATGLILPIGEWVVEQACHQILTWQAQGLPPTRVAVNVSGRQLLHSGFTEHLRRTLQETGLDPSLLELEVTETVIVSGPELLDQTLRSVQDLGLRVSVDDFGTGYSSLAQLKRLAVNTLKIDKSFVQDVHINPTDAAIATAIIGMGNTLNLRVIAEGVENQGQLDFLKALHCDEAQGFLVSRPMPPEEVPAFFEARGLWRKRRSTKAVGVV
ncbi:MAG: EAL domain-containing protein [Acidobacteria bacterium]|nr:EAL domain-containing protein [Acidobacteriota bacterium]